VSEREALEALLPLAQGAIASIASAGIAPGMPGPVSRGNVYSVAKHVAALSALCTQTSRTSTARFAQARYQLHARRR